MHKCLRLELHKCYVKLVSGWALIKVNFDLLQEIGPKDISLSTVNSVTHVTLAGSAVALSIHIAITSVY